MTDLPTQTKNKHLTFDERLEIQNGLTSGLTFKDIAGRIKKDPSTISKEVKAHLQIHKNGFSSCDGVCPYLLKAPFVCNGCPKKSNAGCRYTRILYIAKQAQVAYELTLRDSRTGIALNKESFYKTAETISIAVRNGQHIYHAIQTNNLPVSCSTVYNHIKKGYYTISPLDLPRVVKFKQRRRKKEEYVPKRVKEGRTYEDYLLFIERNPGLTTIQMDTVIGRVGGKVILTVLFPESSFLLGFLVENKTAKACSDAIVKLKETLLLHGYSFGDIVPVILTDNGGEFGSVETFENDIDGEKETHMFFCEANAPYEKAQIEKNHTLLREILPKGKSFDDLTQEELNLIFSHVNAVKRKRYNGKSAYDMFTFTYTEELASVLGITYIPATEVVQSPALLN